MKKEDLMLTREQLNAVGLVWDAFEVAYSMGVRFVQDECGETFVFNANKIKDWSCDPNCLKENGEEIRVENLTYIDFPTPDFLFGSKVIAVVPK